MLHIGLWDHLKPAGIPLRHSGVSSGPGRSRAGAKVGEGSIIAAGALVREKEVIPPNSLVVGMPGKVVRTIDRIKTIHAQAIKYKCEWAIEYGVYPEIGGEKYHGEHII